MLKIDNLFLPFVLLSLGNFLIFDSTSLLSLQLLNFLDSLLVSDFAKGFFKGQINYLSWMSFIHYFVDMLSVF